ncbi:hypothetical protein BABINDRAFT_160474 [Babjeviella inositovora NRRL Y-12698]|uniref:F-box domain-containing protein n=1 Tax=Babjeviella inositovora NRRL Y-12698 TaxID=984486 RepID=A0A1E3QTN9_9ASCO|nr:uncharacterized protein BABINDRAFT_160474 [Babjeviella inositovora NRRL Y-12698]ODQ81055.1 hypothetical protein BABINDRAFT_160474 [Babjeviella inositovora NRRL Y-12698]
MPELFQDIRFRNAVTFKDMAMGMQRIVQANKHSHSKSVRMVKLRPHLLDERACLNTLLNRVTINYRGLNLGLNSTSLGDLLTIIEKDKSNVQGVQRLRLICPLDTNLEWKVFELIPNLHTLELIPSRMAPEKNKPPTTEGLPASLPLRVLSLIHSGNIAAHPTIPFCNLLKTNRFPNLAAVTIVGYDFSCLRQNATSDLMFKNLPQLKHLILENNKSLNWDEFLQIFQSSGCELESLSLREDRVDGASHLRDFGSETFRPLKHLKQLDVTGSSLSFQGLMKVLRNCGSLVESLYIGHCQHIWFKNGTFNQLSTTRFFELDSVLEHAPRLRQLYLNQSSDLNNYTLKMLHPVFKEKKRELDVLDVSFNLITGIGLADLFCVSKRNEPTFRVKKLVIDACDVSLEIVKLLEGRYCDVVQYQPQKVRWKEFGVNSYVPM